MKEKTTENLLVKLVRMCGLGKIIADVESVSGGLMHRMYKVITDSGVYAVKHLNAEIMKRPGVHENYARAEKIERILENSDIPVVPAMVIGGNKMQKIDDQFFYIFRWQEGRITDWNHISKEMCFKAGNILGRVHAIEPKNIAYQTPETSHIDWQGYVLEAKEKNCAAASLLEDNAELLIHIESELNKARASLPPVLCLSNEDMDPKNIMWNNGIPWMIDLECLDYGNPISHVMQLALQWSGIVTCELDVDRMIAFFDGYLDAYDNGFRGYSDVVGVAYTWVEWLEYNIKRALGKCGDRAERELGFSEVLNTMDRIKYIHKTAPQIREALDARLQKRDVTRYGNHDERICYEESRIFTCEDTDTDRNMDYRELPERLDRKVIYESDYVCLYADKVKLSNGYIIEKYHQIHYPHEAISIVVFNENDEVLLIQSKRYTVMRLEWEIPAGRIEDGESKEDAACRECMEEAGCTVKDLKFLCTQNPSNGMSDCICHVFAARVDTESMDFDENEVKMKKWVSRDNVLKMLKDNETKDGVSILALLFAFEFYK